MSGNDSFRHHFTFAGHSGPISTVIFNSSAPFVCSASEDYSVRLFVYQPADNDKGYKTVQLKHSKTSKEARISGAYFSEDGSEMFTIQSEYRGPTFFSKFSLTNGEVTPVSECQVHPKSVASTCISPKGDFIGLGFSDGSTKIFDTKKMHVTRQSTGHELPKFAIVCEER